MSSTQSSKQCLLVETKSRLGSTQLALEQKPVLRSIEELSSACFSTELRSELNSILNIFYFYYTTGHAEYCFVYLNILFAKTIFCSKRVPFRSVNNSFKRLLVAIWCWKGGRLPKSTFLFKVQGPTVDPSPRSELWFRYVLCLFQS